MTATISAAMIVIPCLNEQETLAQTCESLGFGGSPGSLPPNTVLVLIDNGSVDRTVETMRMIRSASPDGTVLIGCEAERGYVPARRRGIEIAQEQAHQDGLDPITVLIVQADADTRYHPGYLSALLEAANATGPNVLVEGLSLRPRDFPERYPAYARLLQHADAAVEPLLVDEARDVIVDDKIAAFRLQDYLAWGGHRREYLSSGIEIHAETSRLYIRGCLHGARKFFQPKAVAWPSQRRLLEDPLPHFASAGFPREPGWAEGWRGNRIEAEIASLNVCTDTLPPQWQAAVRLRRAHQLVLAGVIPLHIARISTGYETLAPLLDVYAKPLREFDDLTADALAHRPGLVFEKAFQLLANGNAVSELNGLCDGIGVF